MFGKLLGVFNPTQWEIYAIVFIAGLFGGGWAVHKLHEAALARQISEAITTERRGQAVMNSAGRAFVQQQAQKKGEYEKTINDLQARLKKPHGCGDTPVPLNWVFGSVPTDTGLGPIAGPARPSVAADGSQPTATCDAIVLACENNRQQACEPAADQSDALRQAYKDLQRAYNPKPSLWQRLRGTKP